MCAFFYEWRKMENVQTQVATQSETQPKCMTTQELTIWVVSVTSIVLSGMLIGMLIGNADLMLIITSCIGVSGLIWVAKRKGMGQVLVVAFSVLYAIISIKNKYYGEMITYLFMTVPIALVTIKVWLNNMGEENTVEVKKETKKQILLIFLCSLVVTYLMYYVLVYFDTSSIVLSTISITTSFLAATLMLVRSKYYAVAYAMNDVVLIGLWIIASMSNIENISMVVCFVIFLINDIYGFISWSKASESK